MKHAVQLGLAWLASRKLILLLVLTNAVQYTRTGGVRIFMQDETTLVVQDTGIGILSEDLPLVFQRGYTGHAG